METPPLRVDPSNEAQLAAWDGTEGAYWATHADRFDRSLAVHNTAFMVAAAIETDERVLDVGCGTGLTTRDAAKRAVDGSALGVDLSSAMLEIARQRAAEDGTTNAAFLQADAQVHPFAQSAFDIVISRTAAMFFGDQASAFANLRRSLRDGGRLVLLTWQPLGGNEWLRAIATALSPAGAPRLPPPGAGPFSLSDPGRVRQLLGHAGFGDVELQSTRGPMWFGDDADDATTFILGLQGWMLDGATHTERSRATEALRETCVAHATNDGVTFESAAWITTARAEEVRTPR